MSEVLNTCEAFNTAYSVYMEKEISGRRVCKAGLLCPFLSGLLVVRKWSVLNTIAKMSRRCAVALTTKANFIGFSKIRSAASLWWWCYIFKTNKEEKEDRKATTLLNMCTLF